MRIFVLKVTATVIAMTLAPVAITYAGPRMGPDYYENATSTCRVHVWTHAGSRPPVSFAVKPVNNGQNLRVLATGGGWSCSCLYRPGDADLYPSVRLVEPPVCSVG